MSRRKHFIVGCGSAALAALEKIRSITSEDEMELVTMEESYPYSPTSLPYLLAGRIKEVNIPLRDESYFQKMKGNLMRGRKVIEVNPDKKEVVYKGGEIDTYDSLLIACGSEPVKPPIRGLEEVGFLGLHTLADYKKILEEIENKNNIAVLGAGLIGMEIAAALLEKGYQVKIIEKEERVLPLYFDREAGTYIEEVFANKGAQILVGKEVNEVKKERNRIEISLAGNDSLDADVLITAVGAKARTSLAEAAGIKTNRGIIVDRRMRTSIEDIFAAGDVAEAPNFFTGELGMNPILPSAIAQGEVAGANMAGENAEYEGWISRNVFNFFGHTAFSVGLSMPPTDNYQILKQKNEEKKQFKKLIYDVDTLVGGIFLNTDVDPGVIHYLIRKRVNIGSYKEALFQKPKEISRWLMLETERKKTFLLEA